MREILFRGKRVDNGEWVSGRSLLTVLQDNNYLYYIPQQGEDFKANPSIDNDRILSTLFGNFYQVYPKTIGQYTGLNDKNDEKIFDKHIVKICGGHNFYGEITYSNDTASYWIENKRLEYYIQLGDIKPSCIEVIGNVIDNPEYWR